MTAAPAAMAGFGLVSGAPALLAEGAWSAPDAPAIVRTLALMRDSAALGPQGMAPPAERKQYLQGAHHTRAPGWTGKPFKAADIRVHMKDSEMTFFINESLLRRPVDQLLEVFVA
ncbi:MAG: hypothetical protein ABIW82_06320 [Dokdonella sp.]